MRVIFKANQCDSFGLPPSIYFSTGLDSNITCITTFVDDKLSIISHTSVSTVHNVRLNPIWEVDDSMQERGFAVFSIPHKASKWSNNLKLLYTETLQYQCQYSHLSYATRSSDTDRASCWRSQIAKRLNIWSKKWRYYSAWIYYCVLTDINVCVPFHLQMGNTIFFSSPNNTITLGRTIYWLHTKLTRNETIISSASPFNTQ